MVQVGIIINNSRELQSEAVRTLELITESTFIHEEIVYTEYPKHAIEIAMRMAAEKQVLVAVGGDGTSNEVLNGWHKSKPECCALGIIPNGTGNDFSKMLKPFNPETFVRDLEALNVKTIDYALAKGKDQERAFLNVADLGFGAKVVQLLERQRKKGLKGAISYSLAILRAFLVFKKKRVEVVFDGTSWSGKVLLIAFCNGSDFGNGLSIYPEASVLDAKLGLTIVGDVSLLTYASKIGKLRKGEKIDHPRLKYASAEGIEILECPDNFHIELDGELATFPIKRIEVVEQKLPVIC